MGAKGLHMPAFASTCATFACWLAGMFTWKCPPGNETDTAVCSITAVSSCMDRTQTFSVPYDIAMYQGAGSDVTLSLVRGLPQVPLHSPVASALS